MLSSAVAWSCVLKRKYPCTAGLSIAGILLAAASVCVDNFGLSLLALPFMACGGAPLRAAVDTGDPPLTSGVPAVGGVLPADSVLNCFPVLAARTVLCSCNRRWLLESCTQITSQCLFITGMTRAASLFQLSCGKPWI